MRDTVIGFVLGTLALVFVLLLAGVGSELVTEEPPAVSPYSSSSDTTAPEAGSAMSTSSTEPAGDSEPDIVIKNFDFSQPSPVAAGSEVTVVNQDEVSHTWTSRDGVWNSGTLTEGETFSVVLDTPGEYEFFCSFHPSMVARITVEG